MYKHKTKVKRVLKINVFITSVFAFTYKNEHLVLRIFTISKVILCKWKSLCILEVINLYCTLTLIKVKLI